MMETLWSCWTKVIRLIMGRHEESLVPDLITQIIFSFGWDGSIIEQKKFLAYAYDVACWTLKQLS